MSHQAAWKLRGKESLSSRNHGLEARPRAGDNMENKKDPAFLELTIWEGAVGGDEISNTRDDKIRYSEDKQGERVTGT